VLEVQGEDLMVWDSTAISKLNELVFARHRKFVLEQKTDRKNASALWNKYLKSYDVQLIKGVVKSPKRTIQRALRNTSVKYDVSLPQMLREIIDLVNYKNEDVSGGLVIPNPDRSGQYILISREIAERILVFGMI
jgi:hypothetical protein